jgi:hypothetical protein
MRAVLVQIQLEVEVVEQEELEQMLIQVQAVLEQIPLVLIYWLSDMEQHLLCQLLLTQLYQVELPILLREEVVLLLHHLGPVVMVD